MNAATLRVLTEEIAMDEARIALFRKLLTYPVDLKPAPACSRCSHSAEQHLHGDPLSCAHCALSPIAHTWELGCSFYTPQTRPYSGASCRAPKCECLGYVARLDGAP